VIAVIPFILYNLWEDIDKKIEYIAITILVVGNVICWGASSLFHCVPWKPKEEIFIQKIGNI
jgi:predicted membrane channel-forming protein YqfA (hemolysin III family)